MRKITWIMEATYFQALNKKIIKLSFWSDYPFMLLLIAGDCLPSFTYYWLLVRKIRTEQNNICHLCIGEQQNFMGKETEGRRKENKISENVA